jgi:lipopolysaccharide/colanic/teichoic acid biosynthesis glycosyltransferase
LIGRADTAVERPKARDVFRETQPDPGFYRAWGKRLFDVVVASLMLLFAAPFLLILMGIVALDGGRPVFAHSRVGRSGRAFKCLKIRSMRHGAEAQLAEILAADSAAAAEWAADAKLTNDPRVTRIGSFLRKSSLDELPQLVNVLRGEMSLVGPRPVTEDELDRYGAASGSYLVLKPGLTGPWQVDGRNAISYDERVALDVGYAQGYGFARDIGIVAKTGLSVLRLTGR